MEKEKQFKSFADFTNLYELSKTLRFELRPAGNTQKMLDENKVFGEDKTIKEKYVKVKPYFDRLHREFVTEALNKANLSNLDEYLKIFNELKSDNKNKDLQKKLEKEEVRLRKDIVALFDKKAGEYAERHHDFKKKDVGIFFEEEVFGLLKEKYGKEEGTEMPDENGKMISIFDEWKGFTGYFTKFHETRKNFYKDDGTSTAISTRAIDQNLRRFCDNLQTHENIKKSKIDLSEVEKNFGVSMKDIFSLNYYNKCVLQDGIDAYNKILGGETDEKSGKKKRGINELINENRQKTGERSSFLKSLDKQILSPKDKLFFIIENDEEFFKVLREFYEKATEKIQILKDLFGDFVKNNGNYDLSHVYISKEAFNSISYKWAGDAHKLEELLYGAMKGDKPTGLKYEKSDDSYKFPNFIALSYVKNGLEDVGSDDIFWKNRYYINEDSENQGFLTGKESMWEQFLKIFKFEFGSLFEREIANENGKKERIGYDIAKPVFEKLIKKDFLINQESKVIIKNFADEALHIYQMGKYFAIEKKRAWNPEILELGDFYGNPETGYLKFYDNAYDDIVKNYNHLRNYLTKKPWDDNEKWKLNFDNPTLAAGYDKNKESQNSTVILRKDGRYYLGLMKKGCNKVFDDKNKLAAQEGVSNGKYEKMVYKYFPEASKMIPKCSTQLKDVVEYFNGNNENIEINKTKDFIKAIKISKEIYLLNNLYFYKDDINRSFFPKNDKEKKLGVKRFQKEYAVLSGAPNIYKKSLQTWIDFCKQFLESYKSTSIFDYSKLKKSDEYNSLDGFYKDINALTYNVSFVDVSVQYIEEKNQNGELYLFEIHNKDWNLKDGKEKTGTKNLHTLYFENLFSVENKERNFVFKLNGQAELFFRPKTDNSKLGYKVWDAKEKIWKKIDNKANGAVIDRKRYSEDKIFFHCPITVNREAGVVFAPRFNRDINEFLAGNKDVNIIGIDRGEKNLAYYSVINQKGEILDMGSLNKINGVDYAQKLGERADSREKERRDWQKVEGIKDLKKGYISQVVRKLADLAIKHNAIIVFEDLNMRFKQIRGGIEKSAYQQLEKALIEKLNFLVKKGEKNQQEVGNLLRAYQLTAPIEAFKDMGKQTGIIFYTQAEYTSITDPVSGFRKNIYISNSSSVDKIIAEVEKFDEIGWNDERQSYYFKYDAKNFNRQGKGESKEWIIYANIPRIRKEKENGYWICKSVNPNEMLSELFGAYGLEKNRSIKDQIKERGAKGDLGVKEFDGKKRDFFKSLVYILNLILQVRNSFSVKNKDGEEVYTDFIASPVEPFFTTESKDSEPNFDIFEKMFLGKAENKEQIKKEFNGDANGALNIARKGIVILERIVRWREENEKLKKKGEKEKFFPDLFISYYDWDKFVQK